MTDKIPLISIVMPVYNTATYVREAIESILAQTFSDFELLIFNDGSNDESGAIISSIQDSRIKLFNYQQNTGYVKHLNYGLEIARGKYIARMDSDDISLPERLAKQIVFMDSHPEIGVCGTAFQTFGNQNIAYRFPLDDASIREFMLLHNPLGHPTVIMRKNVIDEYGLRYQEAMMPAEDYRMWYDFSKVSRLANLPEVLLRYRTHGQQISETKSAIQQITVNSIRCAQLLDKGFILSNEEQLLYCNILDFKKLFSSFDDAHKIRLLIDSVIEQNEQLKAFPQIWFDKLFSIRWNFVLDSVAKYSPQFVSVIISKGYSVNSYVSMKNKIKLIIKSIMYR